MIYRASKPKMTSMFRLVIELSTGSLAGSGIRSEGCAKKHFLQNAAASSTDLLHSFKFNNQPSLENAPRASDINDIAFLSCHEVLIAAGQPLWEIRVPGDGSWTQKASVLTNSRTCFIIIV